MPLKASQGINSDCISAAFRYVPEIPRCSNVYASSRTKACVCARVEYNMFGRRCVSCKSGLSSRVPTAPTHTIRLYRRDSTRRSLERGLIGGDERSRGSGSNRFLPGSRWVSSKRRRADLVILQSPPRWPPSQQSQHSGADFAARLSGTDRLCFGGYRLGQLGLS